MGKKTTSQDMSLIAEDVLLPFFHQRTKVALKYLRIKKLPGRCEEDDAIPAIHWLSEYNDNYFETQLRSGNLTPGMSLFFFVGSLAIFFLFIAMLINGEFWNRDLLVLNLILIINTFYALPLSIRYAWFTPWLLPIRVNRKTQKIYFYQRDVSFNPYVRWPVAVTVMEWKNIQAWILTEKTYRSAGYWAIHCIELAEGGKGIKKESPLFIVPPVGTNISDNVGLENIWSYCLYYMSGVNVSSEALSNKKPWFLTNTWLIKWPDEIDKESRCIKSA